MNNLELLRIVFLGDEKSFERYSKHYYYCGVLLWKIDQKCFLFLIVTYPQKQRYCSQYRSRVGFHLMFEL